MRKPGTEATISAPRSSSSRARPHAVQVTGPAARGPKPQIWNPKTGFGGGGPQIAVFQDVSLRADVTPAPINQPLHYQWTLSPDGCSISNSILTGADVQMLQDRPDTTPSRDGARQSGRHAGDGDWQHFGHGLAGHLTEEESAGGRGEKNGEKKGSGESRAAGEARRGKAGGRPRPRSANSRSRRNATPRSVCAPKDRRCSSRPSFKRPFQSTARA